MDIADKLILNLTSPSFCPRGQVLSGLGFFPIFKKFLPSYTSPRLTVVMGRVTGDMLEHSHLLLQAERGAHAKAHKLDHARDYSWAAGLKGPLDEATPCCS